METELAKNLVRGARLGTFRILYESPQTSSDAFTRALTVVPLMTDLARRRCPLLGWRHL